MLRARWSKSEICVVMLCVSGWVFSGFSRFPSTIRSVWFGSAPSGLAGSWGGSGLTPLHISWCDWCRMTVKASSSWLITWSHWCSPGTPVWIRVPFCLSPSRPTHTLLGNERWCDFLSSVSCCRSRQDIGTLPREDEGSTPKCWRRRDFEGCEVTNWNGWAGVHHSS